MPRAYYSNSASAFLADSAEKILGQLVSATVGEVTPGQRQAWLFEIDCLRLIAGEFPSAHFFFEFSIPRMGRRADVIVLWRGVIFVIEFKVGVDTHTQAAVDQVLGYALDLKNFHETSHQLRIVPVLVASRAPVRPFATDWYADGIAKVVKAGAGNLSDVFNAFAPVGGEEIDPPAWEVGRYRPTPTIIEAAQALYRNHTVDDISRSEAGKTNLSVTAAYIARVIDEAKAKKTKAICLVTGVPGAGKTLAGLNIANQRMQGHDDEHAVFLSGNGPLVAVLREALTQDAIERAKEMGLTTSRAHEFTRASAFIQNIHHFRDEAIKTNGPMVEKVVVFDEAQRAWNSDQTSKFMRERHGLADFSESEPGFLLEVMDRNPDWCVVVCLVGGGQEINTGEAGLPEWIRALSTRFRHWDVHLAEQVLARDYLQEMKATEFDACERAVRAPALHLSVSIRSFRAEKLSAFVAAVIDGAPDRAQALMGELSSYPVVMTRDLDTARRWLRLHRRGDERAGLLASSNGIRLKPEGVFVRSKIDPPVWFLAARDDIRSSDYLEDAATEFDVQGLELDWACVCWDLNLRRGDKGWEPLKFRGTQWQRINQADRRAYLLNSYRVLLTRAWQGMIIFVPPGDPEDPTRPVAAYDEVAQFFEKCGVTAI